MKSFLHKYLDIFNSISVDSSLWIVYTCFVSLSYREIPLTKIDSWIGNTQNQHVKDFWDRQKKMKHPEMIFLFLMLDKKNRTLRERVYARISNEHQTVRNLNYDERVKIVELLKQDMIGLTAFDCVDFLGELIGAWMLTCPEIIIRRQIDKTEDWHPNLQWGRSIYPESAIGKDIPVEELELLYILDYDVYYTFETIECRNTA